MAYKDKAKQKARNKAWYSANREAILVDAKARYARNAELRKEKARDYYAAHILQCRETFNRYYKANRSARLADAKSRYTERPYASLSDEAKAATARQKRAWRAIAKNAAKANASTTEWRKRNPEKYKDKLHRRRARLHGAVVEKVDLKRILFNSNGLCGICKKSLDLFGIDFDHIVPLACGGTHTAENIQATHSYCNRSKGAKVG